MKIVKYSPTLLLRWITAFGLMAVQSMAGETATAVATVTAGFVTGITVTSGGSGYTSEPVVTISGGGGSGATAKAVLNGDRVAMVIVLTAGSGYNDSPIVTIEASPKALGIQLAMVPKLTIEGSAGSQAQVESAVSLAGPWIKWTNVIVSTEGTVLVDLRSGMEARFYRATSQSSGSGTVRNPVGFVWIDAGSFTMGSPLSEVGRFPDEVQHTVTLTSGFWISDHETTQAEYESVMGSNPSNRTGDPNYPVENVTWYNAIEYCRRLTERDRADGKITMQQAYRLPTEAEWEFAARAGSTGAQYGDLEAIAWGAFNSGSHTWPVKQKSPSAWGVYDMIGNVSEWCADWYGGYPSGNVNDPAGPSSGSTRVRRGSACFFSAKYSRSAYRDKEDPSYRDGDLGFRPVLSEVR